jgi:hypothetical protein
VPWRGPEFPGEFPTLGYLVAEWIETHCVIPDRATAGQPLKLSDEQYNHLLWQYRLRPDARFDVDRPAAPFVYVGSVLVRSQKWGKGPFSAARICAQAAGPVLFAGWDANGEPVGMPWATPHIQVAAVAEDQTDNIWRALKPMIELGPLASVIPDTGLERINLPGGGLIEPVTSKALTRLGARITYVELDEPHLMTRRNGGDKLADTMRRNVAGMGGRWSATGNAYDPSENSVEQIDVESKLPDVFVDFPESPPGSWSNKRERRRILKFAYRGAPWVDIDRIEAECVRLSAKGEPAQAERFYGNRVVSGSDKAFDVPTLWTPLADPGRQVEAGRLITLGFDGARRQDSTGLVGTDVETGHQFVVGKWARPLELGDEDDWEIDEADVNATVDYAFRQWDVWRLYGDPPYWETALDRWAGDHGADRVVRWWTNRIKAMALALQAWKGDMRPGTLSHDGDELLAEHIGNAVKQWTRIRDEPDGDSDGLADFMWVIRKESPKSRRKIDLAMAACLSWGARRRAPRRRARRRRLRLRAVVTPPLSCLRPPRTSTRSSACRPSSTVGSPSIAGRSRISSARRRCRPRSSRRG